MPHIITGYVRNSVTGAAAPSVPVTLYHDNYPSANTQVAVGSPYGLVQNPVTTDVNGKFSFSMELQPGPILMIADFDGGTTLRYRYGDEKNQFGSWFMSDLQTVFNNIYANGVVGNLLTSNFEITMSGVARTCTLTTGAALVEGISWTTETVKSFTFAANPTLAVRHDFLCLRQHISGSILGRQEFVILVGTVTGTDPVSPGGTYVDYPLFRIKTNLNAGVSTSEDLRNYVKLRRIGTSSIPWTAIDPATVPAATIGPGSITTAGLANGAVTTAKLADGAVTLIKLDATAKVFGKVRSYPTYTDIVSDAYALNFGPGFTVVKRALVNEADINLSGSAGNIHTWKDTNFAAYGTLSAGVISPHSTATISLAAGSWFIETSLNMTISNNVNAGTIIAELTGNGSPTTPDNSVRIFRCVGGVPRTMRLEGRKRVTLAVTTTYTVSSKLTFNSGDSTYLEDGILCISASPD